MDKEKCCGTCKYHHNEGKDYGWACLNHDSDYFSDWTEYADACEEWEER